MPFLSSPSPKKTKVTASYPSVRARYGQRQRGSTKKESDADENARWRRHSVLGGFDSGANPEDCENVGRVFRVEGNELIGNPKSKLTPELIPAIKAQVRLDLAPDVDE